MHDKELIATLQDILAQYRQMTATLQQMLADLSHQTEKTKAEMQPAKTADHAPDRAPAKKGGR